MTEFDKRLIEKAERISRYNYSDVGVLISIADTDEARKELHYIHHDLYEELLETI